MVLISKFVSLPHRFHPLDFNLIRTLHRLREVVSRLQAISHLGSSAEGLIQANAVHSVEILGDEDYVFVTAKDTSWWGIQGIKV